MRAEGIVRARLIGAAALFVIASHAAVYAQNQAPIDYDEVYAHYLAQARSGPPSSTLWMADLNRDPNARHLNDLVTIRVVDSLRATGSADSNVNEAGSSDVKVPSPASDVVGKAFPISTETKFAGSGATTRSTELTATITARVTEVLPNGDLAIESVREV